MRFRVFVLFFSTVLIFTTAISLFSQEDQWDEYWYYGKPIRDIVFSGLRNVSQSELDAIMYTYRGRLFDDFTFMEIFGKLYALDYFTYVEPSTHRANASGSEVILRFNVIELPVVSRIVFSGNQGINRRELNDVIISRVNDIFNQTKVRLDIEAITNLYLEKGYPNVTVTAEETQSGDSSISLVFNIVEQERITISRIEFQGNSRFTNNALRSQLSLRQRSLLNDGAFNEAKLLADIQSITRYYRDRGYIDAQVRDVTRNTEVDSGGTSMVLIFDINEGSEFRFGGVTFEGNEIFSTSQLNSLIASRVGDPVNMSRLEMDMQRVADLYYENGYIYNSIIRTPNKNNQTNVISYTITIVERDRAYIENIIIIGNVKTRDNVILREIPLEPGDVFSRTKILDALRNLYNLQFFSMVYPDTLQGSTENLMDLVFTMEEQPTVDIQFGLTFSGSANPETFPISGLVRWNDRNIAGSGNQLGIELNSSVVDTTSLSVNYLHRWAFGLPLSLGFDFTGNYSRRLATMNNTSPWFNGDEPFAFPDGFGSYEEYKNNNWIPTSDYLMTYEQWYLSLGLQTGYRWTTPVGIFSMSGGFRFGWIRNSYNNELYRPFDPVLRAENNSWTPRNSIWMGLSLDQRDIFYDPSSGYYLYERIGFYGIFDSEREHYIRSDTKFQFFHTLFNVPVSENWSFKGVFAFHAGMSVITSQFGRFSNPNPVIEEANKLAIDGMFIGRGWGNDDFRNKGNLLLDSWIELRIPLVFGVLAWDFFFDVAGTDGVNGNYFNNFSLENLRFSFGGGLRFTIPQFPIRLSLVRRFKFIEENNSYKVDWPKGPIGGFDLVMSFVLSY